MRFSRRSIAITICMSFFWMLCGFVGILRAGTQPSAGAIPERLPTVFKLPARPFLLVLPEEADAACRKVQTAPWAKEGLAEFLKQVDRIVADPNLFPEHEGGWDHLYIAPTGARLQFDPKSPHRHFCPDTKAYCTGPMLDAAWNTQSMTLTASEQRTLAAAWVLTGERKYIDTMKRVFADIAEKYSRYRLHDRSMTHFDQDAESIAGIATSQSIEECNLLTALVFSYDTLAGSGAVNADELADMDAKIWKRGRDYMRRIMALHPSGGNWWIWHACGATVLGVAFGDQELVDTGLNTPERGVLAMLRAGYVNEDGFTGELSPNYHNYPFQALARLALATRRVGIDFYKIPRFQEMFELPLKIAFPDLCMPRLNDGWKSCLTNENWINLYEQAAHWYPERPEYGQLLRAIYDSPMPEDEDSKLARADAGARAGTGGHGRKGAARQRGVASVRRRFAARQAEPHGGEFSAGQRVDDST